MSYRIELAPSAARAFTRLDRGIQRRIRDAIDGLQDNPRPAGVRKLTGADDLWRIRVGDYRVVYRIEDHRLLVLVVRIAHRRDIYRGK
ncbi:MAG: type II toxin-antitoxin system RelE/ParE family toxin [Phycisphaeraceae bacterium]|nr:type II toxin-antitoxin system RelE/ParE family toxin [Phycisphaeraceae bacterium]